MTTTPLSAARPVPPGPSPESFGRSHGAGYLPALEYLPQLIQEYGDIIRLPTDLGEAYFFNHPEHAQAIYRSSECVRTTLVTALMGQSILATDGPRWREQRRLMQPVFHEHCLAGMSPAIMDGIASTIDRWEEQLGKGAAVFDLALEMRRLALEVISRALFNHPLGEEADDLHSAIAEMMGQLGQVAAVFYGIPADFSPARNAAFEMAREIVDRSVYRIIAARRSLPEQPRDFAALLLRARDESSGLLLTDEELGMEMSSMMIAGHDTVALTTAWAWKLLSEHEEAQERLYAEVDRELEGRLPTPADLPRLPYLRRVLDETLRLYPPVWATMRRVAEETEVGGYRMLPGHFVMLSAYTTHRHKDFWEDPERFDPDRFLPERRAERPRHAYFPFANGRHQCLGQGFALMEMPLVMATLAQRYRVRLLESESMAPVPALTLRQPDRFLAAVERRA